MRCDECGREIGADEHYRMTINCEDPPEPTIVRCIECAPPNIYVLFPLLEKEPKPDWAKEGV